MEPKTIRYAGLAVLAAGAAAVVLSYKAQSNGHAPLDDLVDHAPTYNPLEGQHSTRHAARRVEVDAYRSSIARQNEKERFSSALEAAAWKPTYSLKTLPLPPSANPGSDTESAGLDAYDFTGC